MTTTSTLEMVAAALFALAVIHTFSTGVFARLSHRQPAHAGLWHLLAEIEVVFGFWALVLVVVAIALTGTDATVHYLESRNFTEPMFVFVIMVIAASRPVISLVRHLTNLVARLLPFPPILAVYFVCLSVVPLFGSLITEPAAMTLAALMLRDAYFRANVSNRFRYSTLGVLFVNVSVGGTLTHYAAPPVLMVAGTWGWDTAFMLTHFGWKAVVVTVGNAALLTMLFRKEILARCQVDSVARRERDPMPLGYMLVHSAFLVGVVVFAHHPVVFMGLFLFFLGFTEAYKTHQDRLMLREGLLVAFFLAGLVVLGGLQRWWLQPTIEGLDPTMLYFAATALTAVTDNAALTYLGSLVEGLDDLSKYALVAGAVTGGGLTFIANAPNPAGAAILRGSFPDEAINPLGLLLAALPPTLLAIVMFWGMH